MVSSLVTACFDRDYLDSQADGSTQTQRDAIAERWTAEYEHWFAFHDLEVCASQISVFTGHYVADGQLQRLGAVRVTVHVALHDALMPPTKQKELSRLIPHATEVCFEGGHMGSVASKERFFRVLRDHLGAPSL